MRFVNHSLIVAAALGGIAVAGCGSSRTPQIPVSGRHQTVVGSSVGQIVLSQLGAQRIGVQTARVQAVPARKGAAKMIVPYSSVVYAPSGQTFAFTNPRPLTYIEVPVTVERISGQSAYLLSGPKPGTAVVSVGTEELYGVQTGVLAQT